MGRWGGLGSWRRPSRRDLAAVDAALDRLGIGDLAGRQLGELSGGQRQRTLVAQGLAQESDLLLLDEPTTGLDPEARGRIGALLTELGGEGVTVVQATHDLEAARAADVCLLLCEGTSSGKVRPTRCSRSRRWRGSGSRRDLGCASGCVRLGCASYCAQLGCAPYCAGSAPPTCSVGPPKGRASVRLAMSQRPSTLRKVSS